MAFRYRYLLGAMQQAHIVATVRSLGIPEEADRLPQIIEAWRAASGRMQKLAKEDPGAADQPKTFDMDPALQQRLQAISADPLFQASFSDLPTTFSMVDIDDVVAPQREVNLDYVDTIRQRLKTKEIDEVVEVCLETRAEPPDIQAIQTAGNEMIFTSRSIDLRFLGGFPKKIDEADIKVAHSGGQPVAVITLLVGFGAAPISALIYGNRVVLANGFHRVCALRLEGITRLPMVLRHVANPDIEFPEQFLNLPKSYLLQAQRPVLIKDFFDPELTVEILLKPRRKSLQVQWGASPGIVPE